MVKCPRCGFNNEDTDIYCSNCTYPLQDPNTNFDSKRRRDKSWHIGTGRKIMLIIGIIVIAFLLFSLVYNFSQPSLQNSLNVVTDEDPEYATSYTPYQIEISSNGSWYGELGEINHLNTVSGTGSKTINLDSASWDTVFAKITKVSYDSYPLTIKILRNGKVVAENTTTKTNQYIKVSNS